MSVKDISYILAVRLMTFALTSLGAFSMSSYYPKTLIGLIRAKVIIFDYFW